MRFPGSIAAGLALVLAAVTPLPAASPRESLLVTPAWLAAHLADANLVVLHVGDRAGYDAAHVPGAQFVALGDISVSDPAGGGLTLELPPVADLHERLSRLGIGNASRIIVYAGRGVAITQPARVIFTLDVAGFGAATSLLDGGVAAWTRDGHPVTRDVPAPRAAALAPLRMQPLVVDATYVLAHLTTPRIAIVDARTPAFYSGAETGGSKEHPHRTGHIAGARNIPYTSLTDGQGQLKSAAELGAIFTAAGVNADDTIVAYCHIGQQATAVIFAARTLGHPVRLYDGSFEDWSRHPDFPVDNPAKGGGR